MFLKNIISLLIPCLAGAAISFLLNHYTRFQSSDYVYGLLFFVGVCFILNVMYSFSAGSKAMSELLMAGIVIKLLAAFSVIAIYAFINQAGLFNFAIHFMVYYILFTIFEIRYLLHLIKKNPTN